MCEISFNKFCVSTTTINGRQASDGMTSGQLPRIR